MGKAPCCDKGNVKKGPWSPEEDAKLKAYMEVHGTGGNWIALPHKIGLKRCGKSCRLRWLNYLRPNIKHGGFSEEEDQIICSLYVSIGSRWSIIAAQLPGRTDNDIKNYWNTKLKKKLFGSCQEKPNFRCPSTNEDRNVLKAVGISQASLERMQLHMQLQGFNNPFSLYYSKPLGNSMLQGQYTDTVAEIPMQQACHMASMPVDHEGANSACASMLGEFQNLLNPGLGSEQSKSNFNLAVAGLQAEFYDLLYGKSIDCSMVQDDNQPGELGCFKEVNSLWSGNGVEEKSSLSSQDSEYLMI